MYSRLPRQIQWIRPCTLIFISAIAILQTSCTMGAQPKAATWKNSTGAEGFQRLFWQAVKDKDWLQVESHMASNFVYLGLSGNKDKEQMVAYLRGLNLKDFSLGELAVTDSAADAIVTYTITMKVGSSAADHLPARHMAVWQQEKSGWVLVALSEVTDAAKR